MLSDCYLLTIITLPFGEVAQAACVSRRGQLSRQISLRQRRRGAEQVELPFLPTLTGVRSGFIPLFRTKRGAYYSGPKEFGKRFYYNPKKLLPLRRGGGSGSMPEPEGSTIPPDKFAPATEGCGTRRTPLSPDAH